MRFIGADMPEVSDLTLGIMALVAEQEVKAVSRRTRDALPRPGHNWVSDIAKDMHVESHDMLIREAVRKALPIGR